ncbi:hypothetical protein SPI_05504 [Niveomyces insectorum RCEF 264]|uniref:Fungal transcriptional regulatory protein n=1 Tax=Niveomyces insectorum RCEF 264 TaxID=1081102 RepID=A0A167TA66_9HYPO|nr:hypothetical protein SPI_05504 [Niveomyces insectorum RCEF 264]
MLLQVNASPESSTATSTGPLRFQDVQNSYDDGECDEAGKGSSPSITSISLFSPVVDPALFDIPAAQKTLVRYYTECASDLLINLEIANNPLRTLILPRAWSSRSLFNAVCAVAAAHWSNTARQAQTPAIPPASAQLYYHRALAGLRRSLDAIPRAAADDGKQQLVPTDAILTTAMLCKYEIISGSTQHWMPHLDGLRNMITQRGGLQTLEPDVRDFLHGLYGYHHTLSRLANLRSGVRKAPRDVVPATGNLHVDVYFGLTEQIGQLCCRIWELAQSVPVAVADIDVLQVEVNSINAELTSWTCPTTGREVPPWVSAEAFVRLEKVAKGFRYAAFVYLHSVLTYVALKSPGVGAAAHVRALHDTITYTKDHAVARIVEIVRTCLPLAHCEYSALCFALFCAGVETESGDDRLFVLHCIGKLEAAFGIGNTTVLKKLIRHIWKLKVVDGVTRHWQFAMEELGWQLCLT